MRLSLELHERTGGALLPPLQFHQQIDRVVRHVVGALNNDPVAHKPEHIRDVVVEELNKYSLHEHPASIAIHSHILTMAQKAVGWLSEGGASGDTLNLELGVLTVSLQPQQIFETSDGVLIRLIRTKKWEIHLPVHSRL